MISAPLVIGKIIRPLNTCSSRYIGLGLRYGSGELGLRFWNFKWKEQEFSGRVIGSHDNNHPAPY